MRNKKDEPCVYVIKVNAKSRNKSFYCKIGKTSDIEKRFSTIQAYCPYELKKVVVQNTELNDYVEKILHNEFKSKHIRGEWFDLSKEDIDKIIDLLPKIDKIEYLHENYRNIYNELCRHKQLNSHVLPSWEDVSLDRDRKVYSKYNKLDRYLIRQYLNT